MMKDRKAWRWGLTGGLAALVVVISTGAASAQVPPGFRTIASGPGLTVYEKDYVNGAPDYVTEVSLTAGTIRSLTGTVTGAPNGSISRKTLGQFWHDATLNNTSARHARVVVNGTYFSTNNNPAPIAFGLKTGSHVLSYGYGLNEYPGLVRMFNFSYSFGFRQYYYADIAPYDRRVFDNFGGTPEIIGALDVRANKSASSYIGRTFVGVKDLNSQGRPVTILVYSSSYARQVDAANVLHAFGALRMAMLDGGGSTGLIIDGRAVITPVRTIPHAVALYAGR